MLFAQSCCLTCLPVNDIPSAVPDSVVKVTQTGVWGNDLILYTWMKPLLSLTVLVLAPDIDTLTSAKH